MPWTLQQVAEHNTSSSCWIIIHSRVYDVTEFLPEHPGGAQVILEYAGRDVTSIYDPIHPPGILDKILPSSKHLGTLGNDTTHDIVPQQTPREKTKDEMRVERAQMAKPPLHRILNLADMEDVAKRILPYRAEAYYSSGSDDEITKMENARAFARFFFQARVMRPVGRCDPSTTILGYKSSISVFVSAAAFAKLGHPLGEANITRGTSSMSLIQMVSSNSSLSPAEIISSASPSQTLFFQLYKHTDALARERVCNVERLGFKAIWLTVDAIVAGNRERDTKSPWVLEDMEGGEGGRNLPGDSKDEELGDKVQGTSFGPASVPVKSVDQDMTWERTIPWLRSVTKLPIVIKGIQCVADAVLAVEAGVDGILLSNHGGRELEYSLPPLEVLYRLRQQRPDVFEKTEVYIDGGIRRGSDVLKALCLGAKAVGLGRPFLYAQSAYGAAGVVKIIRILEREIVMGMRLLGASNVRDLKPELIERVDWQPLLHTKL